MPKVSIIVPVHNPGKYLEPLLESLVHQTFQDIEILLIDDGSTDGSRDTLMSYADNDARIRLFFRQQAPTEKFGEKASVDIGRQNAVGDYIMLVDHDDELALSAVEILYNFTKNETVDIVQGRNISVNEDGVQTYATEDIYPEPTYFPEIEKISDQDLLLHLTCNPIALWTCLIRREFQKELELGDYVFNDTDFIWKLKITAKNFCYVPYYIYKQNEHKDSASGSFKTKVNAFDVLTSFENLERFLKYQGVPYRIWVLFAFYRFRMCYGHSEGISDPEAHEEFINILKKEMHRDGNYSDVISMVFSENYAKAYKELMQ